MKENTPEEFKKIEKSEDKSIVETYIAKKKSQNVVLLNTGLQRPRFDVTVQYTVNDGSFREREDHTDDKGLRAHLRYTTTFDSARDRMNKDLGRKTRIHEKEVERGLAGREKPGADKHIQRNKKI